MNLKQYNPDFLDKERLWAVTKCDIFDDEMLEDLKPDIPDVPYVFISSIAAKGLLQLKDKLWQMLIADLD